MKHADDLAHGASSFWKAESIAHRHTDRRSNLSHDAHIRICQSIPYRILVVLDADGAGRTEDTALSAVHTLGGSNLTVKCRHNHGVRSTMRKSESAYALQFAADTHTVAAENTFVRIADNGRRTEVQRAFLPVILEADFRHTEAKRQRLQITVTALDTGGTVSAVSCQKQFNDHLPVFFQFSGIGEDLHTVSWLLRAGCKHPSSAVLHRTQATGTERGELRVITKCRNVDASFTDNRQDILLVGKFYLSTIYCNCSHICPPYSSI